MTVPLVPLSCERMSEDDMSQTTEPVAGIAGSTARELVTAALSISHPPDVVMTPDTASNRAAAWSSRDAAVGVAKTSGDIGPKRACTRTASSAALSMVFQEFSFSLLRACLWTPVPR